jgi:hypothetical protein
MTGLRLFAIFLIFCLATVAWMVLGTSVVVRTQDMGGELKGDVSGLWGTPQSQQAPTFLIGGKGSSVRQLDLTKSRISADFESTPRQKGLLWYATYQVDFRGAYTVSNPATVPVSTAMRLVFPDSSGAYDGFAVSVDGKDIPVSYADGGAVARFDVGPGKSAEVLTGYKTGGLDSWTYVPTPNGVDVLKDFALTMNTNFADIDYPDSGVSPNEAPVRTDDGWTLTWAYTSLVSGRPIGLVMPKPANPGPLAWRITYFAPVSLLFFFAALVLLTATRGVKLHPVHYGFLAAAFFAFHLLFAYLVDRIDINVAFVAASLTSIALVVGYLFVVVGRSRALVEIAICQVVFLVLFSYSFFFEGMTGLAITIGAILTLAYFMTKTAHVDWEQVFVKRERAPQPVPASAPTVV